MNHNKIRTTIEIYAVSFGPPSSPPINTLLKPKIMKQVTEQHRKTTTEYESVPGGVSNLRPLAS